MKAQSLLDSVRVQLADSWHVPRGVTVVEALIVLLVVSMVATLVLANYRSARNQLRLRQVASEVVSAIREAQSHALSATEVGGTETFGYGVFFNQSNNTYRLFAEKTDPAASDFGKIHDGADKDLPNQPPPLPNDVTLNVDLTEGSGCSAASSTAHIIFFPPLPSLNIARNFGNTGCGKACLFLEQGNQAWRIKVEKATGLVDSELGATGC